jgi:hypothetical protein
MDEPNRDKDTWELESAVCLTLRSSSATLGSRLVVFFTTQSEKTLQKSLKKSFDTCKKILHHLPNALTVVKNIL